MSGHEKESCDHGISFKCMHSSEAIEMLLSHAPLRYSIKEISGMTDFHRNTVRPAVKELVDKKRIHQFGSSYYGDTVSDHYRNIARSIHDSFDTSFRSTIQDLFPESFENLNQVDKDAKLDQVLERIRRETLRDTGRNIVKNNLKDIIDENYEQNFNHNNLVEALLHLKMSYPFADMKITKEEKQTRKGTKTVEVVRPAITFDVETDAYESENEVYLNIYPCLCAGDPNYDYACEMVVGALEGSISAACNAIPREVRHVSGGNDPEHGQYCQYFVHANFTGFDEEFNELAEELNLI